MNGVHTETLRDVSRTLVDLLKTNLADVAGRIALASPKSAGTNLLTLFLYKVTENPDLKNAAHAVVPQPDGRVVVAPLEQRLVEAPDPLDLRSKRDLPVPLAGAGLTHRPALRKEPLQAVKGLSGGRRDREIRCWGVQVFRYSGVRPYGRPYGRVFRVGDP